MKELQRSFVPAGIVSICAGLLVILCVAGLKHYFGYPEIIREEPGIIMERLLKAKSTVPYLYYFGVGGFGITVFFFSILFSQSLSESGEKIWSGLGRVCGIVSGVLLYVGIIRYSILFPKLAQLRESGEYSADSIDLVFITMNTYVGESVAEHSQFLFTALMLIFFAVSAMKIRVLPKWLCLISILIGIIDLIGNLEHFGFSFAFMFNRTGPMLLSIWMIITGVILIKRSRKNLQSIDQ